MTSSFAHVPQGSIPYAQHFHVRKPGFGEIRLDANNNILYPSLVKYVDSLILAQTAILKTQATTTGLALSADPISIEAVFGGFIRATNTVTSPSTWTIAEFEAAFKNQFNRDIKVDDNFIFTINNQTAISLTFPSPFTGIPIVVLTGSGATINYFLGNATQYGATVIGKF
jgi:hypothetical protein